MAPAPDGIGIQHQYAQQLADDLRKNREEQDGVRAQVAELESRLASLGEEQAWLEAMCRRVAGPDAAGTVSAAEAEAGAAAQPAARKSRAGKSTAVKTQKTQETEKAEKTQKAAEPAAEAVPAPAAGEGTTAEPAAVPAPAKKAAPRKSPAKKAVPRQRKTVRKTSPTASGTSGKRSGPSLPELVQPLLSPSDPRSVNEIVELLRQEHPERATSKQLVRNAVGALISRGAAELVRQQKSVFYIATAGGAAPAGTGGESLPAAGAEASGEEAPASA